jgi:hypothetical protein
MVTERRRQILLGAVAIVLAVVAYQVWPRTSTLPIAASNQRSAPQGSAAGTTGSKARAEKEPGKQSAANSGAPDVHLEALEAEHPKPGSADRNLFRFKPKAPPPPPPSAATNQPVDVPPAAPPGPPPPPPIKVKFIGLAEREVPGKPARKGKWFSASTAFSRSAWNQSRWRTSMDAVARRSGSLVHEIADC